MPRPEDGQWELEEEQVYLERAPLMEKPEPLKWWRKYAKRPNLPDPDPYGEKRAARERQRERQRQRRPY